MCSTFQSVVRSYTTAYDSDRQSRRRPAVHFSCSGHWDTHCLQCLLFICQDALFHLCLIHPETHVGEAWTQIVQIADTVPSKPASAQPSKHYDAILSSFHPLCPSSLSTSAFLHCSVPAPDLWKPSMNASACQAVHYPMISVFGARLSFYLTGGYFPYSDSY